MKRKLLTPFFRAIVSIWKLFNWNKKSILIYTDSRGYDVVGKWDRNPFNSYIGQLVKKYRVSYEICPEKHTTILDFLVFMESIDAKKYDHIILHCGVVDFSPRPISNLEWVLESKQNNKYVRLAQSKYPEHYESPLETVYQGERTQNLYSFEFLQTEVIPRLQEIDKLVWISSNRFVPNWEGNYTKGRPANINELVSRFDSLMVENLSSTVNLRVWSYDDIKKFTIDNIHFTEEGFAEVSNLIENTIVGKVAGE